MSENEKQDTGSVQTIFSDADVHEFDQLSFREGLDQLDQIVRLLESNQLELEQSVENYEKGVALLALLKKKLEQAQQKITVLMGELEPETSDDIDSQLS